MDSLLDLIQSLESGLTDIKITSQKESIEALITGMKNIPLSNITCKEIDHLVDFLSDRLALSDPNITNLILDGFIWLTKSVWSSNGCSLINSEQAERIVQNGIFGHLSVQSLTKSGRLKVFQLLHCFLTGSQLTGIQSMKSTFIKNYLVAIDGEKDPQILQLIFQMNAIIIKALPSVAEFIDELFETTSVYFPIDFSPPPGGGISGITRDVLVASLHKCLFAMRNTTGHLLMPLICEKLESDWTDGQLDALSLLTDCLHGQLMHSNGNDGDQVLSDGNPIEMRHISPYLGVIFPALIKIANQIEKRRNKTHVSALALSCVSGLIYAYSKQTNEQSQLEDFAVILLRSFGLSSDKSNKNQSSVIIPSDVIVDYIIESFKSAQNNALLCSILLNYTIPCLSSPLISDSAGDSCHLISTEELNVTVEKLPNWQSCISLLNRIFLSITEENLIKALHNDVQIMKTLNRIKDNGFAMITKLHEYTTKSTNLSEILNGKIIHFSVLTCRLCYSIMKYSTAVPSLPDKNITVNSCDSNTPPQTQSYSLGIDSIFNIVCSTILWLNKYSSVDHNNNSHTNAGDADLLEDEAIKPVKDELLSFIPVIYCSCDLFVAKLDEFLFSCLKNCPIKQPKSGNNNMSNNTNKDFAMEVLKYCSFKNMNLLKKAVEFIVDRRNCESDICNDWMSLAINHSSKITETYWVDSFTSLLCFICEGIVDNYNSNNNNNTRNQTDQHLHYLSPISYLFELCQNIQLFVNFTNHYSLHDSTEIKFIQNQIIKLNSIFRIITSQCNSSDQILVYHLYKDYYDEVNTNHYPSPLTLGLFTILCGIISGLRPDVIKSENPVSLLDFFVNNIENILHHIQCSNPLLLSVFSQTVASLLNKTDDECFTNVKQCLSSCLDHFFTSMQITGSQNTFVCFLVLWSIRGLLSSYAYNESDNRTAHKELGDFLIKSRMITFTPLGFDISSYQKTVLSAEFQCVCSCLDQADEILLKSLNSTSSSSSLCTFSHCYITDSYIRNILQQIIEPMHSEINLLIDRIRSQPELLKTHNCFTAFLDHLLAFYLKITVRLPSEFFTDELIRKVIPFALYAVTSIDNTKTQLAGLHFISVVSEKYSQNSELCSLISQNQADDLFGRLPKLMEISSTNVKQCLSSCLDHFFTSTQPTGSQNTFVCFLVLWSIRGLLSSYTYNESDNRTAHKDLGDFLIKSRMITFTPLGFDISSYQKTVLSAEFQCVCSCLDQADEILLKSLNSTSSSSSLCTFSHCYITDSYIRNILQQIIEPMHSEINLLIDRIRSQPELLKTHNCFTAFLDHLLAFYLKITVRLPSEFFTDGLIRKVIPFALYAVTSIDNTKTQLAGLHFISVVSEKYSQNSELCSLISQNQADDLFGRLPKLMEISSTSKEYVNIRLTIARCLNNLIRLPEQVVNRHRDITVLPVLDQLVDDPNRFVRIEAVRARNLWLM
ncbi:unnamed protein product [Trichobilharzia szidati]|nr:unnamed protein product [Trichobilharzia szidati]